ncbi:MULTISPECIES: HAD-IIIA family hydrolase [unclassified Lentimicrobium]|uniref:D-glycero-alpha-D-manno-heptose-1,7-bisphosphate 7-phosphatase n=1 Tax=unclassified Lentimicrobium TaxID=2677434 RepID=UPI001557010C|nr:MULTISPECIES: HAD family hydrolase [unclassified Lentimicrobium]NPD46854.1 HAD family hydrolase [Lentimicrobium sp. S6]NPD84437.1 HAD family hydrolase [Lentimicrobium sp. L6]
MNLQNTITTKRFLFLDRDGVINKRKVGGYITKWEDFEILPGVLEAITVFSSYFDRIIIVTNQQGIGKGLMSADSLQYIHEQFGKLVEENHGHIDAFYYCPMLKSEADNCRKPGIKMALKAQEDFPEIDMSKSMMIGDTASDMNFAKNAGMTAILLQNEHTIESDLTLSNYSIKTLTEVSNLLK